MDKAELEKRFTYHAPTQANIGHFKTIRNMALNFARYINGVCPDGREKSTAITKLDETVMWANASLARGEIGDEQNVPKH